jgi:ATP-dependent DNA helicase RecG
LTENGISDLPIQRVKGIGPERAKLLEHLGIRTIRDALYSLPHRYEDRRTIKKIADVGPGRMETVRGRVVSSGIRSLGRRVKMCEITVDDGSGLLKGKWFNQPFLKKVFREGSEVILSGTVGPHAHSGMLAMESPEYELVTRDKDSFIHTSRIVPIYRLTEGIGQKQLRKIMFGIVKDYGDSVQDAMPSGIIVRNNLPPLRESIRQVHFPGEGADLSLLNSSQSTFHKRLAFDELFLFEMGIALRRRSRCLLKGIAFPGEGDKLKVFRERLHFDLTRAQRKALEEILEDMAGPSPMFRLLQGDVGCGKTIVAFMAMLHAVECGYQAVLMAPTEVLAGQHYSVLRQMMDDLGVRSALLAGGVVERRTDLIASGETEIVVGTHALIQEGISFKNLGLAVIDEQHKFGVMQRALLRKKGSNPDVLVMTATPIPRSLALSLYGDLHYSVIDEMPPGRQPVTTKVFGTAERAAIYGILDAEIGKGRQAYVVYPAVEESDKSGLRAAIEGRSAFERKFPHFRIGLLHGGTDFEERERVMASFKKGEIDILVCTTVIEVGVDVPNASVMIVVHAERFGLAQLHQLRGRVGRGAGVSLCILLAYGPYGEKAGRRLDIMVKSNDGFKIAEEDLAIRGPGEFFGTRQSGMPDFKVADIIRDVRILERARKEAFEFVDPGTGSGEFSAMRRSLRAFWKGKAEFYRTG